MKIGMYTGSIPPPVFILNLVNGLADKGDKVFIYGKVIERNYKLPNSSIIQKKFPSSKIGVIMYSIYIFVRLFIKRPRTFITMVKMISQNSKSWIKFLYRSCRVLPPFLDDLDIFHIQWAKTLVEYPEFIAQLQCPVVLSLRGAHINYSPLADKTLAEQYKKYFPMVTAFHAVSDAIARESEKYAAEPDKITIIHPAVKQKLLNDILKTNDHGELLKIISVGRCHWKKGYTFALDAMVLLKKNNVQFHYTIIASGRDRENILYQIHDQNLKDCVSFINGLPHEDVIKKVTESDLFLLSSLEEGISNAVLEAMALGIPVISTDCGGMGEVIINKKNGFLVSLWDSGSMVDAIINFIQLDDSNKKSIIYDAKETIRQKYLLSHQIDQFQSLYNSIL